MLVAAVSVDVEFNALVIFSYPDLLQFFDKPVQEGQNILRDFTETQLGDEIVDAGKVLPILGIDDGGYQVRFFINEHTPLGRCREIFSDSGYVLSVNSHLYVADAYSFWDWKEFADWHRIDAVAIGTYSATVIGVIQTDELGKVSGSGYDIVLCRTDSLAERTAEIRSDSRLPLIDQDSFKQEGSSS